jgi:uncharacterized membrane protein
MFGSSKIRYTLFVALALNLAFMSAQQVRWLGSLPGFSASYATGVSLDGSVVSGNLQGWGWNIRACVWIDYQPQLLPTPNGAISVAESISGDGNTVVGYILDDNFHAVYWRRQNGSGFQLHFIASNAIATDVSSDGRVIVGKTSDGYAFVWQNGYYVLFRVYDTTIPTSATGVSPNGHWVSGNYVVNIENNCGSYNPVARGFVTSISALANAIDLPSLGDGIPSGREDCVASSTSFAVSNTGLVVGASFMGYNSPSRSTVATSWFPLRRLGSYMYGDVDVNSYAYDVSADGTVAVGLHNGYPDIGRAVRWRNGVEENLNSVFLPRPCGSRLEAAISISYDGRYIVGYGWRPSSNLSTEAYILDASKPPLIGDLNGDGCIDDADLLMVLQNFGTYNPDADVNCDGVIDDSDLLAILSNFGLGCEYQ